MLLEFLSFVHLLAAIASALTSPVSLGSDLSIIIQNDLQGANNHGPRKVPLLKPILEDGSPLAGTGILLLDPMPLKKAMQSCQSIGEKLWSIEAGVSTIKHDLSYLLYRDKKKTNQRYWIAPIHGTPSTIDVNGKSKQASSDDNLPVICTQTAPFSTPSFQDTNSTWQVTVHSNNEYLTGSVKWFTATRNFTD